MGSKMRSKMGSTKEPEFRSEGGGDVVGEEIDVVSGGAGGVVGGRGRRGRRGDRR